MFFWLVGYLVLTHQAILQEKNTRGREEHPEEEEDTRALGGDSKEEEAVLGQGLHALFAILISFFFLCFEFQCHLSVI